MSVGYPSLVAGLLFLELSRVACASCYFAGLCIVGLLWFNYVKFSLASEEDAATHTTSSTSSPDTSAAQNAGDRES